MSHEGKQSLEESESKLRAGDGCGEKSGDKEERSGKTSLADGKTDGCGICFNDIIYATSREPFTYLPCGHELHHDVVEVKQ